MANITSVINLIFQAQNIGKVVGGLKSLEKGTDGVASGFRRINTVALQVGAGLLALGKAIQITADFQKEIVDLGRVANIEGSLTDGTLSKVAEEIRVLAPALGKTATEFSALAVESAKLGVAGDNVVEFTKPIAGLSKISGLVGEQPAKLAKSFAALSSITGASNDDLANYAALASRLDDSIGGTIPNIVEFTRQTAAAGKIVGIGIGELAAYGSTLESLGVKSAVSYRAVNSLLVKLASPQTLSADSIEGLRQIGFEASEMADIMKRDAEGGVRLFLERVRELGETDSQLALGAVKQLIGADYGDEILTLSGGLGKLNSALALTGQSSENLARYQAGLEKQQNTLAGQFTNVRASLENLGISIGQALAPAITTILKFTTPVLNAIASFLASNPLLVSSIVGLAISIGAANLVMAAWAAKTLAVNFAMATTSAALGGVSAAIAALRTGFVALAALNPAASLALTNTALSIQSKLILLVNSNALKMLGVQKLLVAGNATLTKSTLLFNNALNFIKANILLSTAVIAGLAVAALAVSDTWKKATEDLTATDKALDEIKESMKDVDIPPIAVAVEVDEKSIAAEQISKEFGVLNTILERLRDGFRFLSKPIAATFNFLQSSLKFTSDFVSEILGKLGVVGEFLDKNINQPLTQMAEKLLSVGSSISNVTSLAEQKVNARSVAFSDLLTGIDSYNNKVNKLISDAKAAPKNEELQAESAAVAKSLDLQIAKLKESKTVTAAEASIKDTYIKSLTQQSKALKDVAVISEAAVTSGEALEEEFEDITSAADSSTQSFEDFKSGLEKALSKEFETNEEAIQATNEKREEALSEELDKKLDNIEAAAEAEESAIDSKHAKEDAALDRQRELEDRAINRAAEAEEAAIDRAAEAEENAAQKSFDAKEAAIDRAAEAEERAIDRANEKALAAIEKQHDAKLDKLAEEFEAIETALEKANELDEKNRAKNFEEAQANASDDFASNEEAAKLAFEAKLEDSQRAATEKIEALKEKFDKQRQARQANFEAAQLKKKEVAEATIAARVAKESAAIDANKSTALSGVEAEFARRRKELELQNASPEEREELQKKAQEDDGKNAALAQLAAEEEARKKAIEDEAQRQAEELKKKEEAEKKALEERLQKEAEEKAKLEEERKAKEDAELVAKEAEKVAAANEAKLAFEAELEARRIAFEAQQNADKLVFEGEAEARKLQYEEAKKQRDLAYEEERAALEEEKEAALEAKKLEQEEAKAKREEAREVAKEKRQEAFEEAKAKREEAREKAKQAREDKREEEAYQREQQRAEQDAQKDLQREQEKQAREEEREVKKNALQKQYDDDKLAREAQAQEAAEARRNAHEQEIASIQLQTAQQLEAKYSEITAAMRANIAEIAAIAAASSSSSGGKGSSKSGGSKSGGKRYKGGRVLGGLGYWVGENPVTGALLPSSEYFVPDSSGYVLSANDIKMWYKLANQANQLNEVPKHAVVDIGRRNATIYTTNAPREEMENTKLLRAINNRLSAMTDPYTKAVKVKPPHVVSPPTTYTI